MKLVGNLFDGENSAAADRSNVIDQLGERRGFCVSFGLGPALMVQHHPDHIAHGARRLELVEIQRGTLSPSGRLTFSAPKKSPERIAEVRGLLRKLMGEGTD